MKKNKMMRIASVLLVAVLVSTCAISGTFAKYVTKVSGEDSARVAKWGIVLTMKGGEVFAKEYKTHDKDYEGKVSVKAEEKVVAPGTSSADLDAGLTASVSGTPEVATRYKLEVANLKDVYLAKGTYKDYTELVAQTETATDAEGETVITKTGKYAYETFDLAADYSPIKWDLKINNKSLAARLLQELSAYATQLAAYGFTAEGVSIFDAQKIITKVAGSEAYQTAVENALKGIIDGSNFVLDTTDGLVLSYDVDPGVTMNYTFELVWAWDFDDSGKGTNDQADTFLGNVAAGVDDLAEEDGKISVHISADITASATQID